MRPPDSAAGLWRISLSITSPDAAPSAPSGSGTRAPRSLEQRKAQTANAREAHVQAAAERALNDPIKVARAVQLMRLAIARGRVSPDQILPDGDR